jgi:hypothetical protein
MVDHGRPDRIGRVHPTVLPDERCIVYQIQRVTPTTGHRKLFQFLQRAKFSPLLANSIYIKYLSLAKITSEAAS